MKFTEEKIKSIDEAMFEKLKENPMAGRAVGIGVHLDNTPSGAWIYKNIMGFCKVEELGRVIEELQMLKEAIEEETGLIF